ncbi:VOC family protein [Algihabitans albus]|uniref:VOC family protein n=1 Tax=Algihabitans albus TaxID=2164067 RepID=UPI0013C31C0A|nr:VOC family protein [Algihabitans albus]
MILNRLIPLINVEDLDVSLDFYRNALGFTVENRHDLQGKPIWALIRHGEIALMLNRPDAADSNARRQRPSYGDTLLYFYVPDAQAAHEELAERGYAPGPLEEQTYGVAEFTLRDPDGYELACASLLGPQEERTLEDEDDD